MRSKDEIKTLLFIILLTAFLVSFEIARDNSFKPGGYNKNFSNLVRVVGPFEGVGGANGANEAAAFLGQFCPLLLAYFLFIRLNKYYRIISLSTFLLCVYSLIFTYSRAGYISIVLSTLFVTLMKDKKNLLIILLLLLTAPKWAPPSMMQRIEMTTVEDEWTGETKLESSANTREIIWDGAVQMIKQHPMGVGFENFKREIVKYIPEGISQRDAHNNYIMIAAELGIIGLIVFIVMWVLLYKCAWSLYRDAERLDDDFYKAISIAFIGCLISMTVTNIFGTHFFDNRVAGVMWIMSGLIIKAKIITSEQN